MDVMTLAAKLTLNTSEFNSNLSTSEKKMQGMTGKTVAIGSLAAQAVQFVVREVKKLGTETLNTGKDFDNAMQEMRKLRPDMIDADFQKLRESAMHLGETTKFTAKEVAQGFYYMALAGWDTEDMLKGIDGVLNLAAASGEDLGRTSDIITDALTAFGLKAEDAGHFVDVLAAASANSNTTVSQMGEAFKYLATTGGLLGYSIDDVAVGLGLLANNGIKSSQAGTSLRRIITSLVSPTDKAEEAMNKLGVSLFEEGTDKAKPFIQVMSELRTIFKNSDFDLGGKPIEEVQEQLDALNAEYDEYKAKIAEEGKVSIDNALYDDKDIDEWYNKKVREIAHFNEDFLSALSEIGGVRGISSLIALMKTSDEDFEKLTSAVEDCDDAAQKMAKIQLDSLAGDLTILNSALDGLKIIVSDRFTGKLRGFVQVFTTEVGKLRAAFEENGFLGMFLELANWIINGLTDAISNPNEQQIKDFGAAIGTFIGKVVAKLVKDLPALIGGIITIGESLASGLVEGLFNGLFGENTEVQELIDSLNKDLNNVEVNNVKANGLLNYLEELAKAGDANVTATDAWKNAVEKLEEIMPGVKEILEQEGTTLQENIDKVRTMTDEFRKQAIHQALVSTLQKEYELLAEQGVRREEEKVNLGIAQSTQKSVRDELKGNISHYADYLEKQMEEGELVDVTGDFTKLLENLRAGKSQVGFEMLDFDKMSVEQLGDVLLNLQSILENGDGNEIWDVDQSYLSKKEVESLVAEYNRTESEIKQANDKIASINSEMEATKSKISTTEKAVQSVSAELGATATGVDSSGANLVTALGTLAEEVGGISFDGTPHAIGSAYIPFDNYPALLHRGERVLTATENRRGYGEADLSGMEERIEAAIRRGMENATVRSYLNGKDITDEVNRQNIQNVQGRRFAP